MALLLISKILILFTLLTVVLPCGNSFYFNFSNFSSHSHTISLEGDALVSNGALHLTRSQGTYNNLTHSIGRATHGDPVLLRDPKTGAILDFTTEFSFIIKPLNAPGPMVSGDGLSFFIGESDSVLPLNSSGGYLGLFDPKPTRNPSTILAVEFDTFPNSWDRINAPHVGIDINSIVSKKSTVWFGSLDGKTAHVLISYTASDKNLNVYLSYGDSKINPVLVKPVLSYVVDLSKILPPRARVGFSASTGSCVELHQILSWEFKPPTPTTRN